MGKRRKKWKRVVLEALDLPQEADGETVKVTMIGRSDLLVENHRGILEYALEYVRLLSGDGVIRVEGRELMLSEFGAGRAYVRGNISGWSFEGGN